MEWDINRVFVPTSGNEMEILKAACAGGWEPYAINGSFHYFKRLKQNEMSDGSVSEQEIKSSLARSEALNGIPPISAHEIIEKVQDLAKEDTVIKDTKKRIKK